jgi:nitrogen regulatory protein PII
MCREPLMKLLVLVLNKEEFTEQVLERFVDIGVPGATIIETVGMGRVLSQEIPIFAGFVDMMAGARPSNKTIFTLVEDDMVENVRQGVEDVIGKLDQPGTGILFAVNVDYHAGVVREWKESVEEA